MKVSLNWVKQFTEVAISIEELVSKIDNQLGTVESVIDLGARYSGVVVGRVVECQPHPNADRLQVCSIDDGGKTAGVERDQNNNVQVVCGAPNVHADMLVAWLPPATVVPNSVDSSPLTLEVRDIRGQKSYGMLASPKELGFSDNHEGLLEIDVPAQPGDSFMKLYQLDDHLIDIENKMFTHRPDCFGQLGVAREIAGILGKPFVSPQWYKTPHLPEAASENVLPLVVRNELPELVPRFMVVALSEIEVKPMSLLQQTYLSRVGIRPINNLVDATNYMMMLTAQPMHVYDYDKVKAIDGGDKATLVVRYPKPDEKLLLLNGKTIEPKGNVIMIATEQAAIGLGGIMGGKDTEVDEHTTRVILECATFDMYAIRRSAMALGLFSDAVTRFTKGQSPLQNAPVLAETVHLLAEQAGAKVASHVVDESQVKDRQWVHPPVPVASDFINRRLGLGLDVTAMRQLLQNVECNVETEGNQLTVTTPFWRTDIETREDVVEEVGRLYGYDHLPLELPKRAISPVSKDPILELQRTLRHALRRAGANELLTYSFVHGNLLDKVGQDRTQAFQLANALSPDLQFFRLSLTPSLLEKVHMNVKAGYDEFALFELGKAHTTSKKEEDGTPREMHTLSLIYAAEDKIAQKLGGAAYYQAKHYFQQLLSDTHAATVTFTPLEGADTKQDPWIAQIVAPFEPAHSALLRDKEGRTWGIIGEFRRSVQESLKLPSFCAGFEVGPLLFTQQSSAPTYVPLSRFPKITQDICLKVSSETPYQVVEELVSQTLSQAKPEETTMSLHPVDIFQRQDDSSHRQITLRLSITSYERTMTDKEVSKLLDEVAQKAGEVLHAERI